MLTKTKLIDELRAIGVKAGMNLLVHSSLKRVGPVDGGAETQSLVMRSRSGTVRWIDSIHDFSRLDKIRF